MTRIWGRNPEDYKNKVREKRARNLHQKELRTNGPRPQILPKRKQGKRENKLTPRNWEDFDDTK